MPELPLALITANSTCLLKISKWTAEGYRISILCAAGEQVERYISEIRDNGIAAVTGEGRLLASGDISGCRKGKPQFRFYI